MDSADAAQSYLAGDLQEDSASRRLVYFGLCLYIVGQMVSTMGMLLMKRAAEREADLPFYRRKLWASGFCMTLINTFFFDAIVFATTPMSLVAPLSALNVVYSNISAHVGFLVHKEPVSRDAFGANVLIVIGIMFTSTFGPHCNRSPTLAQMHEMALQPAFLMLALPGFCIGLTCMVMLQFEVHTARSSVKVLWCAFSSAFFGAVSALCFKGVATSFRRTFEGFGNELVCPGTYILPAVSLVCATSNINLMNATLEGSSSTFGMPVYWSLQILLSVLVGGTFYEEFDTMESFAGFHTGELLLIGGVVALACVTKRQEVNAKHGQLTTPLR